MDEQEPQEGMAKEAPNEDDLLEQAGEAGKAAIDFGKKTGRLVFNMVRKGLEKAQAQLEKHNATKEGGGVKGEGDGGA